MKKLISLSLAIILMLSFSIPAFAAEETGVPEGSYNADVTGTYVEGTTGGTVFSVDISWSEMSFTYHAQQEPVWDAENHTYSDAKAAYWEGTGTITVTNHSNAKISATPAYNKNTGFESANMSFSTEKLLVDSAESGAAQTGTITVTPSGSLPANTENQTIGTITIAIAHNPDYTKAEMEALIDNAQDLMDAVRDTYGYSMPTEIDAADEQLATVRADCVSSLSGGSYDNNQERLNRDYARLLQAYNNLKALTGL